MRMDDEHDAALFADRANLISFDKNPAYRYSVKLALNAAGSRLHQVLPGTVGTPWVWAAAG